MQKQDSRAPRLKYLPILSTDLVRYLLQQNVRASLTTAYHLKRIIYLYSKVMKQKNNRKFLIIFIAIIILLSGLLVIFRLYHYPTTMSYEDANGKIYECSRPLKAKMGTVTVLGHPQGLIPVNQAEANKYCSYAGIE